MAMRRAHYVLSTHWDREWYEPFQDFRFRLVQLLDRVLEGFSTDRLKGPFQTDGQAIILEDYLEVRPDRRRTIEDLARAGKLVIGPWYVLPDEFLVSGESIVRNLRLGRKTAEEFGGRPSHAGFVCDLFGHISQMPQILAGFGIDFCFLWRGVDIIDRRLLRWRGADGTEIPAYRFGAVGYCSYASAVRNAFEPNAPFDRAEVTTKLDKYIRAECDMTAEGPILLFDGGDHQEWDQQVYEVLLERMKSESTEVDVAHTSLDAFAEQMLPHTRDVANVVEGELREPARHPLHVDSQWLIPGILSSRIWIKQQNAHCQTLLTQWAEPMSLISHLALGLEYPHGYLNIAWRWLLKNHPHDSICGCSIDQVHEDMKYRFSQCRQIGQRLTMEAARQIAAAAAGPAGEHELHVVVFNPRPRPIDEIHEVTVEIPVGWPSFNEFFGFEPKPAFRIFDPGGHELAYQRLTQQTNQSKLRTAATRFPHCFQTHDVRVSLRLRIPALGYTTLTVQASEAQKTPEAAPAVIPTRHPNVPGLATSERSMANEHLAITIEPNGGLTLLDKRTNQTYRRLLTFEDTADIGDGWYHGQAVNDQTYVSSACRAAVALVHDGPLLTAFRVRMAMPVPVEFLFDDMVRSDELTELSIDSLVTLRAGADRVEIHSTIDNQACDHRLRALFPSEAAASTYLADSAFDVIERPIALRGDNHAYRELEVETKPQQTWTAVFDERRGLAVISDGLMETAVRDLPKRPLALTLYRCTRRTVFTDGEPGGQLRGRQQFRFWVLPLCGQPDRIRLCEMGHLLSAGLRTVHPTPKDTEPVGGRRLPKETGLFEVRGAAVLSSLQYADEHAELRLFNPAGQTANATIHFDGLADGGFTALQPVNLESQPIGSKLPIRGNQAAIELKPKQIATYRLEKRSEAHSMSE